MWIAFDLIQDSPSMVEFHEDGFISAAAAKLWIATQKQPWAWATVFIAIPEVE